MNYDQFGQCYVSCDELTDLLYKNPELNIQQFLIKDSPGLDKYNFGNHQLYAGLPELQSFKDHTGTVDEFDQANQNSWRMPAEYLTLDIAKWLLDQCQSDAELQRVGQELLLYQERNLFNLLRYLKYLVDTMRKHNIVWGVGRGSSVASYVLFLIGIHKIDSMYYDLSIEEFLR
jgi:DNA polymerase III alpha subunit